MIRILNKNPFYSCFCFSHPHYHNSQYCLSAVRVNSCLNQQVLHLQLCLGSLAIQCFWLVKILLSALPHQWLKDQYYVNISLTLTKHPHFLARRIHRLFNILMRTFAHCKYQSTNCFLYERASDRCFLRFILA